MDEFSCSLFGMSGGRVTQISPASLETTAPAPLWLVSLMGLRE